MSDMAWETLGDQAVSVAGVVYFLAFLSHCAQWGALRKLPADEEPTEQRTLIFGRFGVLLTGIATAVHLVALVGRGMAADPNRVPWGNMYEFVLSGTFVVSLMYLVLYHRYRLAWLAPWVVGFVFVILMADVILLREQVAPLTEALSSPWLVIHVVAAVIATGLFSLGGIIAVLFLVKARWEDKLDTSELVSTGAGAAAGGEMSTVSAEPGPLGRVTTAATAPRARAADAAARRTGILARIPASNDLDRISYRIHAIGFPIWTFAVLIAGPIWAQYAWSRYWGWDAKEVWAFITWVVYAAYLHARATAGWKGRNAAIIALVGMATLWFNFIGINYFFGGSSQHSYAAPTGIVDTVDAAQAETMTGPMTGRG